MRKLVVSSIGLIILLIIVTTVAVLFASGYRLARENGKTFVEGTGVMVLTSKPDEARGARVYINNHLTTATDNTINLQPGEYVVRIEKDGYFPWNKTINVKQGEVSQANAFLFPNTPKLNPITTTGASNVTVDDTDTLIAYTVTTAQPRKNGIYLMNMSSRAILPIGGL
ncbi:MAG TPA: PEGA domain-containing protein, partial [Candidatus Levybacteria bacterium]|nr:PEGA domain-containing protein [Candidatus Levybacteria bacterium]